MRLRAAPFRRVAFLLALAAGLGAVQAPASTAYGRPAQCGASVPYRSGDSGYHTFRIPAAVRTPDGGLLAFAEGRWNSSADNGDIDLVLRRSLDGGCTWQPLQLVADAGTDTVGNPVPVVDPRTGDVVLVTCRTIGGATQRQVTSGRVAASVRRVYVQRSTDGGRTWSPQRDITATVKASDWRWYAVGPGHAVALRHASHRGRLLVPANHSSGTTGRSGAHSLSSDDGGHSWHVGYVSGSVSGPLALNESTLAELPGGTVYINARDHDVTAAGTRADAYSADGGLTLSVPFRPQPQLTGPTVQGSVLQVSGLPWRGPLLFSGPSDPDRRRRMQVRASDDAGKSWRPVWSAAQDPAGYSDLVRTGISELGLLYETGPRGSHDTIRFTRLPLALASK
ncbi:sialidase family protein [Streptomyces sp. H27-C3]|uniref:sialidase family protein n=1 Tax=Streptomyces sp. H27-C3 TaxID=3046305 RepID=UPI0024BA40CF|nr:sialidase family protein [Streptomyces sp. H27-C3]MDJ0466661.1 sialidase family protein [Streptomyces sp. H27-C3]